jgi:hypothetical protein
VANPTRKGVAGGNSWVFPEPSLQALAEYTYMFCYSQRSWKEVSGCEPFITDEGANEQNDFAFQCDHCGDAGRCTLICNRASFPRSHRRRCALPDVGLIDPEFDWSTVIQDRWYPTFLVDDCARLFRENLPRLEEGGNVHSVGCSVQYTKRHFRVARGTP